MFEIYETPSRTYLTFAEKSDDEWAANGLFSTPFKSLVSVALSTMTTLQRTIADCKPFYGRVSTFEELLALDDEELTGLIKPVARYNRKTKNPKKMSRQIVE